MVNVTIRDIAYYLPPQVLTNEKLQEENPDWNMSQVEQLSGIRQRHIADEGETALDLAFQACRNLFERRPDLPGQIDGLFFCTQSPDYPMPPNACVLHKKLELPENVFCLDFNAACSGFIYGLALARGLMVSGMLKNILLVNAETYSKYIHKQDRSTRVLFSDGGAVSWIGFSETSRGLIDIACSTAGEYFESCMIPAGGSRQAKSPETSRTRTDSSGNVRTLENLHMDGMAILGFVNSRIPEQIRSLLAKNKMSLDDIDLFIFHQASKTALDCLERILEIPPQKVFQNLAQIGNTVSCSIPIALQEARDKARIKAGDKILMSGFGAGLSWGTAILQV